MIRDWLNHSIWSKRRDGGLDHKLQVDYLCGVQESSVIDQPFLWLISIEHLPDRTFL